MKDSRQFVSPNRTWDWFSQTVEAQPDCIQVPYDEDSHQNSRAAPAQTRVNLS